MQQKDHRYLLYAMESIKLIVFLSKMTTRYLLLTAVVRRSCQYNFAFNEIRRFHELANVSVINEVVLMVTKR